MIKLILDFVWICSSLVPYMIFFVIKLDNKQEIFKIPANYFFSTVIFGIGFILTWLILKFYLHSLSPDCVKISTIRPAEPRYIPVYISYFIITLGVSRYEVFFVITLFLILFIFKTKVFYFNVLAYFFGYHFYETTTEKGIILMLILKEKDIKQADSIDNLLRLNNFSFIEADK